MRPEILILSLCLLSCRPEFDPNSDYTPTDVIYGNISIDNDTNYIEVYAAFPAEYINSDGSVTDPNAIYYSDSIELKLFLLNEDGERLDSILCPRTTVTYPSTGTDIDVGRKTFFYVDSTRFRIQAARPYRLQLDNLRTGKVSISEISCHGRMTVQQPQYDFSALELIGKNGYQSETIEIANEDDREFMVDVYLHTVISRRKVLQAGGDILKVDTLTYIIRKNVMHESNNVPAVEQLKLSGRSWIDFLITELDAVPENEWRRIEELYMEVESYSGEMKEYVSAAEQFNAISQERPFYTNVFDARSGEPQAGVFYSWQREIRKLSLSDTTKSFLDTSATTVHLGF